VRQARGPGSFPSMVARLAEEPGRDLRSFRLPDELAPPSFGSGFCSGHARGPGLFQDRLAELERLVELDGTEKFDGIVGPGPLVPGLNCSMIDICTSMDLVESQFTKTSSKFQY